jgi:hypothetical protein
MIQEVGQNPHLPHLWPGWSLVPCRAQHHCRGLWLTRKDVSYFEGNFVVRLPSGLISVLALPITLRDSAGSSSPRQE